MTEKAFVGNAADAEQVKSAGKKEKFKNEEHLRDVKALLETRSGRKVLWHYMEQCKVYGQCMTGNSWTFFNEGQRSVGLKILSDVTEANPEAYLTMMKEAKGANDV